MKKSKESTTSKFRVGDEVLCWGWEDPSSITGVVIKLSGNNTVDVEYTKGLKSPSGSSRGNWDIRYVRKLTKLDKVLK